ncbi:MAG: sigma-70 family RNA polymerase sigma factor [Saprospiraceae bacterium]|uniref:Sigma-70 family RNA polymerase sigma factor n=1 Tax=Candidatus Defluviibacterium haderslevense TaxID=2981993 RepID=A0A9D7S866_9BACT|nr:sigma-70 family RNA polymerase sigma factor [Candidatus Defluviibacterium haderslevense]
MFKPVGDLRNLSPDAEIALAKACCQGEREAQFRLFEQYKRTMFGICLRFMDNRLDAEDLLQEGFVNVFKDICKFSGKGSLEGWIRTIFTRTAIDQLKYKQKILKTIELQDTELLVVDHELTDPNDPEQVILMLQKLPTGFRTILNLYVLEDMSHHQIAKELGIAESTSRSQLTRAKDFLKKMMLKSMLLV